MGDIACFSLKKHGTRHLRWAQVSKKRPGTPRPLARQLRREVHFCCPICGNPILTYHHIIPWREEQHFRPQDMIALCANDAGKADAGAISRSKLRNLKANPPHHKRIRDRFCIDDWGAFTVRFGGGAAVFEGCSTILRIEGEPVIGFGHQANMPSLFLDLRDDMGKSLLKIEDNDWIVDVDGVWDCRVTGSRITVRDMSRRYFVRYRVDAERCKVEMDCRIYSHGVEVAATEKGLLVGGIDTLFKNVGWERMNVALNLRRNPNGRWGLAIGGK